VKATPGRPISRNDRVGAVGVGGDVDADAGAIAGGVEATGAGALAGGGAGLADGGARDGGANEGGAGDGAGSATATVTAGRRGRWRGVVVMMVDGARGREQPGDERQSRHVTSRVHAICRHPVTGRERPAAST
jgi:hypothetical protein